MRSDLDSPETVKVPPATSSIKPRLSLTQHRESTAMPPPEPKPAINRVLGATSGAYDGNVRAILALGLAFAFVLLLAYATVEYVHFGREVAHDFVVAGFGALLSAFTAITGIYIGARIAQKGG